MPTESPTCQENFGLYIGRPGERIGRDSPRKRREREGTGGEVAGKGGEDLADGAATTAAPGCALDDAASSAGCLCCLDALTPPVLSRNLRPETCRLTPPPLPPQFHLHHHSSAPPVSLSWSPSTLFSISHAAVLSVTCCVLCSDSFLWRMRSDF